MAEWAGYNVAVRIDGDPFYVNKVSINHTAGEGDVTSSEDEGFGDQIDTIERAEITLTQATYDDSNSPFGAPQTIMPRSVKHVVIWPKGVGVGVPWDFPYAGVYGLKHDIDVSNLEPIDLTFKSKGPFTTPDDG